MNGLITGGDPTRFFEVGQKIAGTSGLGEFVKNVTERAKSIDLLEMQSQAKIQSETAIAGEKARLERETGDQYLEKMRGTAGGDGNPFLKPGERISQQFGNITHVIEGQKPTSEKASMLSKIPGVISAVGELKTMIKQLPPGELSRAGTLIMSGESFNRPFGTNVPISGTGALKYGARKVFGEKALPGLDLSQRLHGIVTGLKGVIPFAEGGKQLTITEQDAVMRRIVPVGFEDPAIVERNLDQIVQGFTIIDQYLKEGRYEYPADAARAVFTEMGILDPSMAQEAETLQPGAGEEPSLEELMAERERRGG